MEWLWYCVAALGAGVGTGLAGLSAATVMVPILIVLCPSFSGETGAYQATAIALASDILCSAVTAWTYAKHHHIDLRRGWIMLVCILCMCTVGSWAAYLVGNVVLSGFTLFLTFFIGIRFILKPDTAGKQPADRGEKLGAKGIAVSLFFGLTIGFGTGFVGTGGGMMMLVVFTAFLGMELKTAVGTSTFIMTFTALIASVSHMLIHPAILSEKGSVMLFCIVVATISGLVSAQFANRVKSRTVGLVTGVVLTTLGAAMLILNYWNFLSRFDLFVQILSCAGALAAYIIPCVAILLPIRYFSKVPDYVFRKLLHIVAFTCVAWMVLSAKSWQAAVLTCVLFSAAIYPLLMSLERQTWYSNLFVEKEPGEIKMSLLLLFMMSAALIAVCWGLFNRSYIAVTSILMWGVGDATAALIGRPFGKHKVKIKPADGKKSWEGSGAMLLTSFLCGFAALLLFESLTVSRAVLCAGLSSLLGTATELFSPSEYDTLTVPVVIAAALLLVQVL